jgi:hypothetical protein
MATNIDDVQVYIRERMAVLDPDMDTREFTAVSDTWIEPVEIVLSPLVDDIEEIRQNQSLNDVTLLEDTAVDLLLANLLLTRRAGSKSSGLARVFFAEPVATSILDGTIFISKTGLRFISTTTVTIQRFSMQANVEGTLYYVDVPIEAESEAAAGDVDADSIVEIQGGPTGIVRVTNKADLAGGSDRETNVQAKARAELAVATRDLVTDNSIATVLLENFSAIRSLSVVGYGDDEMDRDLLTGSNISLGNELFEDANGKHIGGKVDPYVLGTSVPEQTFDVIGVKTINRLRAKDQFDHDPTPLNVLFVSGVNHPIVEVVRIDELDPGTGEPSGVVWVLGTDYSYELEETTLSFSTDERALIRVLNASKEGRDIRVTYKTSSLVSTIQAFLQDRSRRVLTADILAKHVVPASVVVTGTVGTPSGSTLTATDFNEAVEAFVEAIPVAATLEKSDIINLLGATGADYVNLDTLLLQVTVLNTDGSQTITAVTDRFDPALNVGYLVGSIDLEIE